MEGVRAGCPDELCLHVLQVSIVALRDGQIEVVQASMLGSILSNVLLVMGFCFLLGGLANMRDGSGDGREQSFATGTAQTTCSLLTLSVASMIIPATLYAVLDDAEEASKAHSILLLSRGTAVILLLLYVLYLWFQLRTHKNLFDAENQATQAEHADELTTISVWAAGIVLVVVTVIVAICADYLVGSIDELVETVHISKSFIGLILIPIVGNAAEHVTACVVAVRDKMDLAMGVAIGSSIQIALLVTPFLVILGWLVLDQPMTLRFGTCECTVPYFSVFCPPGEYVALTPSAAVETVVFALSVMVVSYTVQDGKSNYLEGAMVRSLNSCRCLWITR